MVLVFTFLLPVTKDTYINICPDYQEHYGKEDPADVAKIKALYHEIDLQGKFAEFESKSYEKLTGSIEAHPSKAVQAVLKSFLGKIYKRQK